MVFGKYDGEEMEVHFTAETEKADYGVPRSPVWEEVDPDTVKIASLTILGIDVDPDSLPFVLRNAIIEISNDVEFGSE
jgi:hypothetical protein